MVIGETSAALTFRTRRMASLLARLAAVVCLLLPAGAYAGAPSDQVRSTVDRVLEILNDPKLASAAAKQERRQRLRQVIYPRFDFADMSRRSLGPAWRRATAAEQQEFVRLFTQLLEDSYINNIEAYNGERVLYGGETQDQDYAEVETRILTPKGEQIAVDYRLHDVAGNWRVYDVVIENVSLVNNYRGQFNRILDRSSFAELLDRIRQKLSTSR